MFNLPSWGCACGVIAFVLVPFVNLNGTPNDPSDDYIDYFVIPVCACCDCEGDES